MGGIVENLYEVMGLGPDATQIEIKRRYRKLAREWHPDAGGDPREFARIAEAYEVLSDEQARARYDATGFFGRDIFQDEVYTAATQIMGGIVEQNPLDVTRQIVQVYKQGIREAYRERRIHLDKIRALERFRNRVLDKPEVDVVGGHIAQRIDGLRQALAEAHHSVQILKGAVRYLSGYTFSTRKPMSPLDTLPPGHIRIQVG
jgi:curved DNA-binding protein CbpA